MAFQNYNPAPRVRIGHRTFLIMLSKSKMAALQEPGGALLGNFVLLGQ